ncbi:TPA: hypothetical protein DDZ75_02740 [Patescibacteria group bacterium]|nr:hypothetical protein [Patescibacteria group bacterium]
METWAVIMIFLIPCVIVAVLALLARRGYPIYENPTNDVMCTKCKITTDKGICGKCGRKMETFCW